MAIGQMFESSESRALIEQRDQAIADLLALANAVLTDPDLRTLGETVALAGRMVEKYAK